MSDYDLSPSMEAYYEKRRKEDERILRLRKKLLRLYPELVEFIELSIAADK